VDNRVIPKGLDLVRKSNLRWRIGGQPNLRTASRTFLACSCGQILRRPRLAQSQRPRRGPILGPSRAHWGGRLSWSGVCDR